MTFEGWITLGTLAVIIGLMLTNRFGIDIIMFGGLVALMLMGVLEPTTAIRGFADPSVIMIAGLFVIAAAMKETGAIALITRHLLGRPRTIIGAQLRMMPSVAILSGFMNNTPIVAMFLPIISGWARKLGFSPSKLYMPLSYAAVLGGKLSIIGSASNIIVLGLYINWFREGQDWLGSIGVTDLPPGPVQFWGIAAIGLPCAVTGIAFIAVSSRWLLPSRKSIDAVALDARQYQVEMVVTEDAPIIGRTIGEAGLRSLPGLFLSQIERAGRIIHAVSPFERIHAGDRLAFVGVLDSVVDLRRIRGLVPATDQVEKLEQTGGARTLVEAVVSSGSPLVGKTVRSLRFRSVYNAAIIAVHRKGQHIRKKVGNIILQPGDTLVLDTHADFIDRYRNSPEFYLISPVEDSRPVRHDRAKVALGILALLVLLLSVFQVDRVLATLVCAVLLVATRCIRGAIARQSINWEVLIILAAALGMGEALKESGTASYLAGALLHACNAIDLGPQVMLLVLFVITTLFAQLITNYGAAVLMFPIAMATAEGLLVNPLPFVFMIMLGAGSSYLSPLSSQTNIMVYGPGGYRFLDFARLGLPLTVIVATIATVITPLIYPFMVTP